ncbi:nucleoside-diphosphate kinase [Shouchella sp. JSM 1781072]|uniref:nucleoside-diphosphate kinase n=1 Tax=Bacillaceae TaxID=186817 RepID=UPI000C084FA4|nr:MULTISPECIES: nucleoside-diphosphate kinase [Bacillaceae]UTR08493.1 nucleoside-diphosphate kinase [Alkalihalobacillus sp. LMS6]
MERTYIMIKPDGVQRNLIGAIVSRFEQKGFKLVAGKLVTLSKETAETHYGEHREKPFFNELVSFITSGPVFAMVWEGDQVVKISRQLIGATNPAEAAPGSIRGDYAVQVGMNIIHGSDSTESSAREMSIFFSEDELSTYEKNSDVWV